MRTITVVLTLAGLLSCHSAVPAAAGGNVKFRIVKTGDRAAYEGPDRRMTYAPTAEMYEKVWTSVVGGGDRPAIDFAREAAIFIAAGQRPTGGFRVEVKGIERRGDTLVVDASVAGPPPDSMVIQSLTSPFAVVAVEKAGATRATWKDAAAAEDRSRTQ